MACKPQGVLVPCGWWSLDAGGVQNFGAKRARTALPANPLRPVYPAQSDPPVQGNRYNPYNRYEPTRFANTCIE